MTPESWLTATSPQPMLQFLEGNASERKLRLFAVACCRDVWDLIKELEEDGVGYGCLAVELGERLAEGRCTPDSVLLAVEDRVGLIDSGSSPESQLLQGALPALAAADAYQAACSSARHCAAARNQEARRIGRACRGEGGRSSEMSIAEGKTAYLATAASQCNLLRDIFSPFTSPHFDPSFRTSTVLALAQQAYSSRDFTRIMPILADALSDAGAADDSGMLRHLRGPGPHCRGCHVLDVILGKS